MATGVRYAPLDLEPPITVRRIDLDQHECFTCYRVVLEMFACVSNENQRRNFCSDACLQRYFQRSLDLIKKVEKVPLESEKSDRKKVSIDTSVKVDQQKKKLRTDTPKTNSRSYMRLKSSLSKRKS